MRLWVFLKAKRSEFAGVGSALVVKVLNVRAMAPLSWLALVIGACLALMGVCRSSEFAGVGSSVVVAFDSCLALMGIS